MRRAGIGIIYILLFFQGNALTDQVRYRVEKRYLAFFTLLGVDNGIYSY